MEHNYLEAVVSIATIIIAVVGNVAATKVAIGAMKEQMDRLTTAYDKLADTVQGLAIKIAIIEHEQRRG